MLPQDKVSGFWLLVLLDSNPIHDGISRFQANPLQTWTQLLCARIILGNVICQRRHFALSRVRISKGKFHRRAFKNFHRAMKRTGFDSCIQVLIHSKGNTCLPLENKVGVKRGRRDLLEVKEYVSSLEEGDLTAVSRFVGSGKIRIDDAVSAVSLWTICDFLRIWVKLYH